MATFLDPSTIATLLGTMLAGVYVLVVARKR